MICLQDQGIFRDQETRCLKQDKEQVLHLIKQYLEMLHHEECPENMLEAEIEPTEHQVNEK